jgi:hypothetical protein
MRRYGSRRRYADAVGEVSITVRRVPIEWRNELAARAAREQKSLQEYMLGLIETAVSPRPPLDEVIERSRARARASSVTVTIEDILESRDADR